MLVTIISFIIVLGILIFIHEFGHFITAKKAGIKVEEFALGMGPRLISHKKGETVYSIRAIPVGGFCNMTGEFPPDADMSEEELKSYEQAKIEGRAFHQQSIAKKFAVIFMGPFMNFLLAVIIFIFVFSVFGIPVDTSSTTIIGDIVPQQPASEAGLKPGDRIISINNNKVAEWKEMSYYIHDAANEEISIKFLRDESEYEIKLIPEYDESAEGGIIGIFPELIKEKIGFFNSVKMGVLQTGRVIWLTLNGFAQMIHERSTEGIGGPIAIASIVGQAARIGIENLLNWMAIISINLGIINLLPIPALDGGRLVFIFIEFLRGKPVPAEKEGFVHFIGFVLLILLMVFFTYKDIIRTLF